MRTGQRSYTPGIGPIQIELVEAIEIAELPDSDAIPDGFESAAAMRAELESIYGARLEAYQAAAACRP